MKRFATTLVLLLFATVAFAQPSDLIISEYVEGSSLNKAVELYNGTGVAVDLSDYALEIYFNGNTSAGTTIALAGTLADGATYVVAASGADGAILAAADQTTGASLFNGDDAVTLTKSGAFVDVIGQVGVDPGSQWGSGLASTQDNTLRRLASDCTGDTNAGDAFDPSASFEGFAQDTFGGLGAHTASCSGGGGGGALGAGAIAIIGFNFDNPDELAFVALEEISAGTTIHFTDNGWLASGGFRDNEGTDTYTFASDTPAGTVITPALGSVAFSGSGDQILAYTGASASPTFLYALNSEGSSWQADATSSNTSALPAGLADGLTAVALDEIDNAVYGGMITGSQAALLSAISEPANWSGSSSTRQTMPSGPFTVGGGGAATDLFISEYVEGSSLNKAVEIYNGTGAAVDLSDYALEIYFNGNTSAGTTIALSGMLADGATYVVAASGADGAILAAADQTTGASLFNGDDAVTLTKSGAFVDVIGQVGVDPGSQWGSGLASTQDNTLRRLASDCTGDTNAGDAFDPSASFEGFAQDTFGGLGAHTASCSGGGTPGNAAPQLTQVLASQTIPIGSLFTFDYDATDPDGDLLTFTLEEGPSGATVDASSGLFEWTPSAAESGASYTVMVRVTDGALYDETTATLTVESAGPGEAPTFTAELGGEYVASGTAFAFDYDASDPQGDAVTFSMAEAPAGATIDAASGLLEWTPSEPGVYEFVVEASDGTNETSSRGFVGATGTLFPGETGATLRASLRTLHSPDQTLGYDTARDSLYLRVERNEAGEVCGVYTGWCRDLPLGVDPSTHLYAGGSTSGINAEHTWPQSLGADSEPQRSDMHHLFPSKSNVNSARSNDPYGEIPDAETDTWYRLDEALSSIPITQIDAYSEDDNDLNLFEPREAHKGNGARAMLYFYAIYESAADQSFLEEQLAALLEWNVSDVPDAGELRRTALIRTYQGNINPLIVDTTLGRRLAEDLEVAPPPPPPSDLVTITEARAFSDGTEVTVEGVVTRAGGSIARIQDATAGIAVYQGFGAFEDAIGDGTVQAGTRLRVTGTLTTFNGLLEIEPSSFEVLAQGAPLPAAQRVTLSELAANGESYESELIRVVGLEFGGGVGATFEPNTTYSIRDASLGFGSVALRTPGSEEGSIAGSAIPEEPVIFQGVLSQYASSGSGGYQLQPVLAGDVFSAPAACFDETQGPRYTGGFTPDVENGYYELLVEAPAGIERVTVYNRTNMEIGTSLLSPADEALGGYVRSTSADSVLFTFEETSGTQATAAIVPFTRQDTGQEHIRFFLAITDACGRTVDVDPEFAVSTEAEEVPEHLTLEAAWPNPSQGAVTLSFALPESDVVDLLVYDMMGRRVMTLASGRYTAGRHLARWDGRTESGARVASGIYLVRLQTAGGRHETTTITRL